MEAENHLFGIGKMVVQGAMPSIISGSVGAAALGHSKSSVEIDPATQLNTPEVFLHMARAPKILWMWLVHWRTRFHWSSNGWSCKKDRMKQIEPESSGNQSAFSCSLMFHRFWEDFEKHALTHVW